MRCRSRHTNTLLIPRQDTKLHIMRLQDTAKYVLPTTVSQHAILLLIKELSHKGYYHTNGFSLH